MQMGLEALMADPETRVIVIVSKPPEPRWRKNTGTGADSPKPVIVTSWAVTGGGAAGPVPASTLKEAADQAWRH